MRRADLCDLLPEVQIEVLFQFFFNLMSFVDYAAKIPKLGSLDRTETLLK